MEALNLDYSNFNKKNDLLQKIKIFLLEMGRPVRPRGKIDKRKKHQEIKKPKVVEKKKNNYAVETVDHGFCRCGQPASGPHGRCDFHLSNERVEKKDLITVFKGTCPRCGNPTTSGGCDTCG